MSANGAPSTSKIIHTLSATVTIPLRGSGPSGIFSNTCYNRIMPSRSSKPKDHDFTRTALRVVEQAIGEKWDGSPLPDPHAAKNPAAVALGKLGGKKGGAARAAALSPKRRSAIAKKAARARWSR